MLIKAEQPVCWEGAGCLYATYRGYRAITREPEPDQAYFCKVSVVENGLYIFKEVGFLFFVFFFSDNGSTADVTEAV